MKKLIIVLSFILAFGGLATISSQQVEAAVSSHYQNAPTVSGGQVRASWGFTGTGTNTYYVYVGYKVGTSYMLRLCQSGSGSSLSGVCYYDVAPSSISRQWVTVLTINGVQYWSSSSWLYKQYY